MRSERRTIGLNRTLLVILGLLVVALGVAVLIPYVAPGLGWSLRDLPRAVGLWPWWPLAAVAGGIVLVVLAVSWLRRLAPGERIARLGLPAADEWSRLSIDPGAAVRAANDVLGRHPDVRSSRLSLEHRAGRVEVGGTVVLRADGAIDVATSDVLDTIADLGVALEVTEIPARVRIAVRR